MARPTVADGKRVVCPSIFLDIHGLCFMKSKSAMTLDRVLSRFGLASRNEAREAILAGRVKVNGRVVRDPGHWIDLDQMQHPVPGRDSK